MITIKIELYEEATELVSSWVFYALGQVSGEIGTQVANDPSGRIAPSNKIRLLDPKGEEFGNYSVIRE